MKELSGLYFPFSRPLEIEALKQMLLIFDSITFLDPVADDEWRAKLLLDMADRQGDRFLAYQGVNAALPMLLQEGAVQKHVPDILTDAETRLASAASLSDLCDAKWVRFANTPSRFRMPHGIADDNATPTWQIFRPKLPTEFIDGLDRLPRSEKHIFHRGGDRHAWDLSYAAGSSITTNLHLAAAERLGLAPITDSDLHHRLLVSKAAERAAENDVFDAETLDKDLAAIVSSLVLRSLVPKANLKTVTFEQILRFRQDTKALRQEAVAEISKITSNIPTPSNSKELLQACQNIEQGLNEGLRHYRGEMSALRNKFWPKLLEAPEKKLAAGGLAAVALSFIGGPAGLLVGSLAAVALSVMKTSLDLKAERDKIKHSVSPAVAYLTRVKEAV
ncbi:MAG: hypothetical protein AAFX39_15995 [Pseudomonadota bacterium]